MLQPAGREPHILAYAVKLRYVPGNSPLHHWECRCKLLSILIVSIALIHTSTPWLALFSLLLAAALALARLPVGRLLRDCGHWLWLLLIIFWAHALFRQETLPPAQSAAVVITSTGLRSAAVVSWRLALVVLYGILFTSVTSPRDMQNAIAWFLALAPFVPARRTATMLSLTIRFFPLMLEQAEEIKAAMLSRGGKRSLRSYKSVRYFVLSLFRRSLLRCDEIACALAARGYREDLPVRLAGPRPPHWLALAAVWLIAILSVWGLPFRPL